MATYKMAKAEALNKFICDTTDPHLLIYTTLKTERRLASISREVKRAKPSDCCLNAKKIARNK